MSSRAVPRDIGFPRFSQSNRKDLNYQPTEYTGFLALSPPKDGPDDFRDLFALSL